MNSNNEKLFLSPYPHQVSIYVLRFMGLAFKLFCISCLLGKNMIFLNFLKNQGTSDIQHC